MCTVLINFLVCSLLCLAAGASLAPGQQYILASKDRTLKPAKLYATEGTVTDAESLLASSGGSGPATSFSGINSTITFDFGKNIAGTVHFTVDSSSGADQYIGFTFTESSLWISPYHCDSGTSALFDDPLWFHVPSAGEYGAPKERQRGGFRYMSLWHNSTGTLSISNLSVNFTASPEMDDPTAYAGHFISSNEKLNRVWYAGAYTNQLCIVDPAYNNALGIPGTNWYYNASIASKCAEYPLKTSPEVDNSVDGTSVLIDGAKRDRLVWPGDIFISGPSIFVSTGSLDGIKNGIDSIYPLQNATGQLPWAGTPFTRPGRFPFSFTYHHYTLIDTYDYYLYTGDLDWLKRYWSQFTRALEWSLAQIDESKLANVTSSNDWLRSGMGGHNVEANAILHYTLERAIRLAEAVGDTTNINRYSEAMKGIKQAINANLWDASSNLFFDNDHNKTASAIRPQDGNSWVIIAGIVDADRAKLISTSLMNRWVRPYGAPAPEAGPTVSPFATGFEVQAHFLAGYPERALELIEFMWADFMLDDPRMTNSSFIEGYSTNGDLHYAPYDNDARISYAHGWATSPTSSLTFLAAGLEVTSSMGKTWSIQPRLGGLGSVSAGFKTTLGAFEVNWEVRDGVLGGNFTVPDSTSGSLVLPASAGKVHGPSGPCKGASHAAGAMYDHLPGGTYTID